jgi:peptidoglycan-N-acetylglucosamine deacetylase
VVLLHWRRVPDPIQSSAARRAQQRRAQIRRRRLTGAGLALALVVGVVVAVGALAQGSRSPSPANATIAGTDSTTTSTASHATASRPHRPSLEAIGDANIQRLAKLGLPIFCGGRHGNEVAFTFDDGPGVYTHYAVKKLTQAHERATFFVVSKSIDAWPGWLQKELKVGVIGDHTATHPDLVELSPSEILYQLASTKQQIESITHRPVYLFRPPYGAYNSTVLQTAKELNLLPIMWTADSGDSLGANWAGIIHNVEAALHPGSIILMHENRGQTIRALTTILPVLHQRHLRSVTLPELFATDPPTVAQVKQGGNGCGPAIQTSLSSS